MHFPVATRSESMIKSMSANYSVEQMWRKERVASKTIKGQDKGKRVKGQVRGR